MWKAVAKGVVPLGCATMIPLAAARSQSGDWVPMRFPIRAGPVVFDGARGRLVLFAPNNMFSHPCQTFEWQGAWQQRCSAHLPSWRGGHAMAYDAARQRVVLFGGASGTIGGNLLADTWLWDGFDWTLAPTAIAPPARRDAAIAFDNLRGRMVLFGGSVASTAALADTWLWDGVSWTQAVTSVQPSARAEATMAFDGSRGVAILFGGRAAASFYDTWTWDGAQWTSMATPTTPFGTALAMANDDVRGKVVLHMQNGSLDTYEWNGQTWTLRSSLIEAAAKSMAFDANRGRVVGCAEGGMLCEWNGTAWTVVDNGGPVMSGTITSDYSRASLTLIGWLGGVQTWSYEGRHWHRVYPSTAPQGMGLIASDPFGGRVLLFGGSNGFTLRNETWEWDGLNWRLATPATSPPARNYGGLAFQLVGARMILFGGMLPNGTGLNDTWAYNGVTWTQLQPLHRPPARIEFGMASDLLRNRVVVFGGIDVQIFGDTWEWDGTDWALRAVSGPSPRWKPGLDFDLVRGNILLFGGVTNGGTTGLGNNDTWAWDGVAWSSVPVIAPPVPAPGAVASMAQDLASNGHVVIPDGGPMLLLEAGPVATVAVVGIGCGGSSGPLEHRSDAPYLGNSQFALEVRNLVPGAPCLVAVSTAIQPVDLGSGCTSYLAEPISDVFLALANASGVAQVRIPIPASAMLRGASAFTQAGALDPQGPLGGIALSNAMQLTIGR